MQIKVCTFAYFILYYLYGGNMNNIKYYTFKIKELKDLKIIKKLVEENNMQKPNFSKLAREFGVSRETIRKYYNGFEKMDTRNKSSKIDKHKYNIAKLLDDEFREFDYIAHLYRYIKREIGNVDYSLSTFNRYINKHFKNEFKSNKAKIYERYETLAGEEAQFDYKENQAYIDIEGNKIVTNIATLTFGYSRFNYREVIADKTTESTIVFLSKIFDKIGGVPKKIKFDNGPSLVEKVRTKNNDGILNSKLAEFLKDYNIDWEICMPYRPESKGKVEAKMKIVDELKGYNGEYRDSLDIENKLQIITNEENNRICQSTSMPPSFLWEQEKERLLSLPSKKVRSSYFIKLSEVNVNNTSLISYKSNKYSVNPEYIGQKVGLKVINNKLHIYYNQKFICSHTLSNKNINYLPTHKKELQKLLYSNKNSKTVCGGNLSQNIKQLDENVKSLERLSYE